MKPTACCLLSALALLVAPLAAPAAPAFSDEAVEQAIAKGIAYLWKQQKPDGSFAGMGGYPTGPGALMIHALLEAGERAQDPRMEKALAWLSRTATDRTYSLGIRCNVWEIANRQTDHKYADVFRKEVSILVLSTKDGSYGYASKGDGTSTGDNSCSQYGLLGVWAGARGNLEIPEAYWNRVLRHWMENQAPDGAWAYRGKTPSRPTMAAAGMASLYVCIDNLLFEEYAQCRSDRGLIAPIEKGLAWFDKNFKASTDGYYMYGVERVALASGYKYFGTADWYKLGATKILAAQQANGSFKMGGHGGQGGVGTAFAILFLVRGRQAVLFNKLERDGDWRNRPRDLASLTRWITNTFEKSVNWQIINLRVPVEEWHDAPLLYITGAKEPTFTPQQLDKLRTFVLQGGTIFSATECNGREFRQGIREIYVQLFPDYELVEVDRTHPLYTLHYTLRSRPKLFMIHNGVRPLVIHTDDDLPLHWQLSRKSTASWAYEAAANLFMYVTDQGHLRMRGVQHWPAVPKGECERTVPIVRVQYAGNWNPEPLALERFGRMLEEREKVRLQPLPPVAIESLGECAAPLALLTGTTTARLRGTDVEQIRRYVQAGGTVLIDAAGGNRDFHESMREVLEKSFGYASLVPLSPAATLFTLPGHEIETVQFRRATLRRSGRGEKDPRFSAVLLDNRPAILLSREDLTLGLLGVHTYGADGYDPEDAYRLLRNAVLLTLPPQPTSAPSAGQPATAPGTSQPAATPPGEAGAEGEAGEPSDGGPPDGKPERPL